MEKEFKSPNDSLDKNELNSDEERLEKMAKFLKNRMGISAGLEALRVKDGALSKLIKDEKLNVSKDELWESLKNFQKEKIRTDEKGRLFHYHQTKISTLEDILQSGELLSYNEQKKRGIEGGKSGSRPDAVQMTRDEYLADGTLKKPGIGLSGLEGGVVIGDIAFAFNESVMDEPSYDPFDKHPNASSVSLDKLEAIVVLNDKNLEQVDSIVRRFSANKFKIMSLSEWSKYRSNINKGGVMEKESAPNQNPEQANSSKKPEVNGDTENSRKEKLERDIDKIIDYFAFSDNAKSQKSILDNFEKNEKSYESIVEEPEYIKNEHNHYREFLTAKNYQKALLDHTDTLHVLNTLADNNPVNPEVKKQMIEHWAKNRLNDLESAKKNAAFFGFETKDMVEDLYEDIENLSKTYFREDFDRQMEERKSGFEESQTQKLKDIREKIYNEEVPGFEELAVDKKFNLDVLVQALTRPAQYNLFREARKNSEDDLEQLLNEGKVNNPGLEAGFPVHPKEFEKALSDYSYIVKRFQNLTSLNADPKIRQEMIDRMAQNELAMIKNTAKNAELFDFATAEVIGDLSKAIEDYAKTNFKEDYDRQMKALEEKNNIWIISDWAKKTEAKYRGKKWDEDFVKDILSVAVEQSVLWIDAGFKKMLAGLSLKDRGLIKEAAIREIKEDREKRYQWEIKSNLESGVLRTDKRFPNLGPSLVQDRWDKLQKGEIDEFDIKALNKFGSLEKYKKFLEVNIDIAKAVQVLQSSEVEQAAKDQLLESWAKNRLGDLEIWSDGYFARQGSSLDIPGYRAAGSIRFNSLVKSLKEARFADREDLNREASLKVFSWTFIPPYGLRKKLKAMQKKN